MAQYITYSAHGLIPPRSRPLIPGGGPQTVAEVLDRWVRECPEADALVGRDRRYTYAELDEAANRAASALASLSVASDAARQARAVAAGNLKIDREGVADHYRAQARAFLAMAAVGEGSISRD